MADFDIAFKRTIFNEGGYVNDADDMGGETYMGVSRKAHPDLDMWKIIDNVKKYCVDTPDINEELKSNKELTEYIKNFYETNYWRPFNLYNQQNQRLANQIFDTAVNMGIAKTKKIMQRVKNEMSI